MQNKYVGDVGDLGKHGLLRFFSGHTADDEGDLLRLGVLWYFHHDEVHVGNPRRINGDGSHTGYLRRTANDDRAEYRNCDPELWEGLRDLVYHNARCVHCAAQAGLLPDDTLYYDAALVYLPGSPPRLRQEMRAHWWRQALLKVILADLVFLDPDNGIGTDNLIHNIQKGTKYAYASDIADLWNRGQSLVVYHHLGREDNDQQALALAQDLSDRLEGNPPVTPLIFSRGSSRVFLVIPRPEREDLVEDRVNNFLDGPWARHFRRAGEREARARPAPRGPRAGARLLAEVEE